MKVLGSILDVMEKISDVVVKILDAISAILIALCALDLFYQVIYRFIIVKFVTIPSVFTEEFARYALIWVTYLAIAGCFRSGGMASVNFIYDRLSKIPKLVLFYITRIIILFFLYYAIVYGYKSILNNLNYISPMMQLPGIYIYTAPFLGMVCLAYETLVEMLSVALGRHEPFAARCPDGQVDLTA